MGVLVLSLYTKVHLTVSLHKTEKGAEIAMEFHKENERKEHEALILSISENQIICRVWK
jgi:hypothetical protein